MKKPIEYCVVVEFLEWGASKRPAYWRRSHWCVDEKVLERTDDLGYARYLKKLYQFIYGPNWRVRYKRTPS